MVTGNEQQSCLYSEVIMAGGGLTDHSGCGGFYIHIKGINCEIVTDNKIL